MSLINQMLQDLDARRSDVASASPFGQQIRAVPDRRRVHPAWWAAFLMGGALIAVVGFVLLRPVTPAPQGMSAQLPLKLDIDLNAAFATQLGRQIATPDTVSEKNTHTALASEPPIPVPKTVTEQAVAPTPVSAPAPDAVADKRKPAVEKGRTIVEPIKERGATTVPEVVPPVKVLASLPAVKPFDVNASPVLNKQIKELTPLQRAENEYRKAILALRQGKRADAIGGLEQALQLDSKHSGARQVLVGLLHDAKQQDKAILVAAEGLAADPAQPGLAMTLARLQLEKVELSPAIETLERTLPYAADKPDYQAFLAALLQRDERHKQAVEQYMIALQRAPQNGVWWMGLGISLQAEGRIPEARESFKRAKATNSLSPELLAFVESRLGQLPQ